MVKEVKRMGQWSTGGETSCQTQKQSHEHERRRHSYSRVFSKISIHLPVKNDVIKRIELARKKIGKERGLTYLRLVC